MVAAMTMHRQRQTATVWTTMLDRCTVTGLRSHSRFRGKIKLGEEESESGFCY